MRRPEMGTALRDLMPSNATRRSVFHTVWSLFDTQIHKLGVLKEEKPHCVVALARKLAVILHRLWRDGTSFRWSTQKVSG